MINPDDSRRHRFLELVQAKQWLTIDDIVHRLDAGGFWDDGLLATAEAEFKRTIARRFARQVKDETGFPVVASIQLIQPGGGKLRVYMPETLFDVEQYRQVIGYWQDRGHYAIAMANGYAKRASDRFNVQLPLPFPLTD